MRTIPLTQGHLALVDDADYEVLSHFKWRVIKTNNTLYAARSTSRVFGKQKIVYMHRQILGLVDPEVEAHHKDNDGRNNQRDNLKVATHSQNLQSIRTKKQGATSQFRGVSLHRRDGIWQVQIRINGKDTHLGTFTDETEAARAYDDAAFKHFGEFAQLNFPKPGDIRPHAQHITCEV